MGVWGCIYGFCLSVYDLIYPDKFLTIFDIDYDHKRALAAAHRFNHLSKVSGGRREEDLTAQGDYQNPDGTDRFVQRQTENTRL